MVVLYTDGACSGNPGPGGWAYLIKDASGAELARASGGDPATTNNKMELTAVIEGLMTLDERAAVRVVTDSQYVSKGMTEWVKGWIRNDWMRGSGRNKEPVKNVDLWRKLVTECARLEVTFAHIRGHAGHPENEECDRMAVAATQAVRFSE